MSGTASKTSTRKSRTAKPTAGSDKETVAASESQSQAQAEQDEKLKQEAEAQAQAQAEAEESAKVQEDVAADVEADMKAEAKAEAEDDAEATEDKPDESDSEKQEEPVESDKPEQIAKTADSDQPEKGSDDDVQLDSTKTTGDMDGAAGAVLGITGALKVRAKSAQGFWRSGVKFLRTKDTYLLVVDEMPTNQPATVAQDGIEPELVLFMSKEKAQRVHREPNLVVEVVELSEVIDIEDMA
ncbi:TPA: hypothetical protein SD634_003386 [Vibrio cholerae]|nr:hypothetical protein [Vibrio cholerae]